MRLSRTRGGALVLATVLVFVIVTLIAAILAAPNAQMARVSCATAKERAIATADAGARAAIIYLMANPSSGYLAQATTPGLALAPSSFYPDATVPGAVTDAGYRWVKGPFQDRGSYEWRVVRRPNDNYEITSVGQVAAGPGGSTKATVFAVIYRDSPRFQVPAAASFANPSGNPFGVTQVYDTHNGQNVAGISGTDKQGTGAIAGVAFEDTTPLKFGALDLSGQHAMSYTQTGVVGGISGGGNSGPAVSAAQWTQVQQIVTNIANAQAAPPTASVASPDPYLVKYQVDATTLGTFPVTLVDQYNTEGGVAYYPSGAYTGITYIKIADGTTVTNSLFSISGSNDTFGILVIDVGQGVTFNLGTNPLYRKNGIGFFQGALIFLQEGTFTSTDPNGLHLIDKNGSNANYLQFNSTAVATALSSIEPLYKFAAYTVK
jgi:hypothetical protein